MVGGLSPVSTADRDKDGQMEQQRCNEEVRKTPYPSPVGFHLFSTSHWPIRPFFRNLRTIDGTASEPSPA